MCVAVVALSLESYFSFMFYYFYRFLLSNCVCQLLLKFMMMMMLGNINIAVRCGVVSGEDGCQELIEDTAEMQKAWIEKMMEKGLCSCDEEHMFDCPANDRDVIAKPSEADVEQQAFDDILDRILGEKVGPRHELSLFIESSSSSSSIFLKLPK